MHGCSSQKCVTASWQLVVLGQTPASFWAVPASCWQSVAQPTPFNATQASVDLQLPSQGLDDEDEQPTQTTAAKSAKRARMRLQPSMRR
jgi:hypothetical protein